MISCNKDCCQCVTDDAESTGSAVLFDPTNEENTDDEIQQISHNKPKVDLLIIL